MYTVLWQENGQDHWDRCEDEDEVNDLLHTIANTPNTCPLGDVWIFQPKADDYAVTGDTLIEEVIRTCEIPENSETASPLLNEKTAQIIRDELDQYSKEDIARGAYWSDNETWFQPCLKLTDKLDSIFRPMFEWNEEDTDMWLEIEYWSDDPENTIVYIISTNYDTLSITRHVRNANINNIVMQIVNQE